MLYEDINLTCQEKWSLFLFRFKKNRKEENIKEYWSLYHDRGFIQQNYCGEDTFGCPIFDGTYSLSKHFHEYKASRRKWFFTHLPAWFALFVSLVSLSISVFNLLINLGIVILQ